MKIRLRLTQAPVDVLSFLEPFTRGARPLKAFALPPCAIT